MMLLRFFHSLLLITVLCMVFEQAYAEPEPKQSSDTIDQPPATVFVNSESPDASPGTTSSILETLKLPTDFEQNAALYALLARSDMTSSILQCIFPICVTQLPFLPS